MKLMAHIVKSWHTRIMQGKYIVIEGHEGTGKTSQVGLLRERLAEAGIESIEMVEPGSVPIAQALREIIKNANYTRDAVTNLLLFTAARRETWQQLAEPALKEGKWVIAGRNWYSTIATQGYAEGLERELIETTTRQFTGENYMHPDKVIVLTMNDEIERHRRLTVRGAPAVPDTFESRGDDFQQLVRRGYEKVANEYAATKIDAGQSLEKVAAEIWQSLQVLRD